MLIPTQIRIRQETYEKIKIIAEKSGRSMNKQIGFTIEQFINDYERVNGKIEIEKE